MEDITLIEAVRRYKSEGHITVCSGDREKGNDDVKKRKSAQ